MSNFVQFIAPRASHEETTIAVISAYFSARDRSEENFLKSLISAMDKWFKTEEGAKAWDNSSHDYNVGDLSNESTAEGTSLGNLLLNEGIQDLEINTLSSENKWSFDTVLSTLD